MPISNPSNPINFPSAEILNIEPPTTEKDVTASSEEVVSPNSARRGLTILNMHSDIVYFDVKEVSATSFMFFLESGAFYEMPYPPFSNKIYAIAASGSGKLNIRELTVL